jgi:UDP-glucuronate 4-epimerase
MRYIELIERATNHKAAIEMLPMQPGEVPESFADIETARRDLGYAPRTPIDDGVPKFVAWFRAHHGL